MKSVMSSEVALVRTVFVAYSACASCPLLALKAYVAWRDPWFSEHWTPSTILLAGIRDALAGPSHLLTLIGFIYLLVSPNRREHWEIWVSLFLLVLAA